MKTIELYDGLLDSLGLPRDEENRILMGAGGTPLQVGKKKLIALSQEVLDRNEWEGKIAFHPLSEDILMGQSPIIHFLQRAVRVRLTNLVLTCMSDLIQVCCSAELQSQAGDPDVATYIEPGRYPSPHTAAMWVKLMDRVRAAKTGDDVPLKVYLSRDAVIQVGSERVKYARVCTIGLPILDGSEDADVRLWDIPLKSKKDKVAIVGLLKMVVGDQLEFGSNSCVPYFHALTTAYVTIAKRIDKIQRSLKKVNKWKAMNFTWAKLLDNLEEIEREIPPLEGNQGVIIKRKANPIETVDEGDEELAAERKNDKVGEVVTKTVVVDAVSMDNLNIPEPKEDDKAPWDVERKDVATTTPVRQPVVGIKLDDFLGGNRRDRDYDRRERDRDYDRRDRDYDRRDRRDRDRDRDYDRRRDDRDYDRDRRPRGLTLDALNELGRNRGRRR